MIEYKTGDLLREPVEALVNTVNCVGAMGRGIALQFKHHWPANFLAYAAACKRGQVTPGRMFVFETGQTSPPQYIVNFPTKRHWRDPSRMSDIESGLEALLEEIRGRGMSSIGLPALGSGLGGLDWQEVRVRIENAFRPLEDVRVVVFEPSTGPTPALTRSSNGTRTLTPGDRTWRAGLTSG